MTKFADTKNQILDDITAKIEELKALTEALDAIDRINDYDLIDQSYAFYARIEDLDCIAFRAHQIINA